LYQPSLSLLTPPKHTNVYHLPSNTNPVQLSEEDTDTADLLELVDDIVPFQMSHNAEAEAADLLIECQQLVRVFV